MGSTGETLFTSTDTDAAGSRVGEIVSTDNSGGAHTSHTIMLAPLGRLLAAVPPTATRSEYENAALEQNVLGKETVAGRRRALRYLRELYLLRPDALIFRALRDLWSDDEEARPLLAALCALARDSLLRASSDVIVRSRPGDILTSTDFANAVGEHFADSYRESTLAKIGRNVFSSWEQTGHLSDAKRPTKIRKQARCRAANVAYSLMLGYLEGARGQALFRTLWAEVLDRPMSQLYELASSASQQGLMEFRHAGGVVEVTFHELLRPLDGGRA
jgi:hypothetical protein